MKKNRVSQMVPNALNDAARAHSPRESHGSPAPMAASGVDELLTAQQRRDEFLATLSHELRGPLGAIQNALAVLSAEAGQDVSARERLHALIGRQVHHMMRLTADLQDVSGISRGQLQLHRARTDLRDVLHRAAEIVAPELQQLGHCLTICVPDSPVWLQADTTRLQQVFQNLLANASKYTDAGGHLEVTLKVRDGYAIVSVRDSGIGIDADTLPHIFDLFMQAAAPARRHSAGLGIGLALVRTLVEMHGGSVAAMSAGIGQGSEFSVRLPLER